MKRNGVTYYYITNLQGDVMKLVDADGNVVASYEYDPYGKVLSASGTMAHANPLRYRGYYYDSELEMYYLQSRYYDPNTGRFINADAINVLLDVCDSFLGNNLFSYCINNPVCNSDSSGYWIHKYSGFKVLEDKSVWKQKFVVDVHVNFLSRSFCLKFAKEVIRQKGDYVGFLIFKAKKFGGMNATRIAQELWFHALAYFVGMPLKLALNKKGVSWGWLNSIISSAEEMEINRSDSRAWLFALTWEAASFVKRSIQMNYGYNPIVWYISI